MKRLIWIATLTALTILFPFISDAGSLTARDLTRFCRFAVNAHNQKPSTIEWIENSWQAGWCSGFILGVDAMQLAMAGKFTRWPDDIKKAEKEFYYCLPDGTKEEDLEKIIVKYADDHPEDLHLDATMFIIKAFKHFYPCDN